MEAVMFSQQQGFVPSDICYWEDDESEEEWLTKCGYGTEPAHIMGDIDSAHAAAYRGKNGGYLVELRDEFGRPTHILVKNLADLVALQLKLAPLLLLAGSGT